MSSLEDIIKTGIEGGGPISIADYMALALSHPEHGYYMRGDPLGAEGDFITSPEISQIFGELIGAWLARQWQVMGEPKAALIELGPGRGTLMADMLRATKHIKGFHEAISVHLVETSPALKAKQWQALAGKHPHIAWHTAIDELPSKPLLLIANEFFDALPIRQFVFTTPSPLEGEGRGGGWGEKMVSIDANHKLQFAFVPRLPPTLPSPSRGEGNIYEYCPAAQQIIRTIGKHITRHGGAALIIDYGYDGNAKGDTLQAVKAHHYHDVLAEPGMADLTAHVDFAALKKAALAEGAAVHGLVAQGIFLDRLGAGVRTAKLCEKADAAQKSAMLSALERLTSPDRMGDLFKALAITHPKHPKPEGF